MYLNVPVLLLFLTFLSQLLASCSKIPCMTRLHECVKPEEFVQYLSVHSAKPFSGLLLDRAQRGSNMSIALQEIYATYLICSVSLFGRVDGEALGAGWELCKAIGSECLSDLSAKLSENNSLHTVAQFVAHSIDHRSPGSLFSRLLSDFVRGSQSVVYKLVDEVSAILKEDENRCKDYGLTLSWLTIGEQYKMTITGQIPLRMIYDIHPNEESVHSLGLMFFTARYSLEVETNPELCHYIANKYPHFKEWMPNWPLSAGVPCRELSFEALMYSKVAFHRFLRDLDIVGFKNLPKIMPWRCWVPDRMSVLEFLGRYIAEGASLGRLAAHLNSSIVEEYMGAVIGGRIHLPIVKGCTTTYDSFLTLTERFFRLSGLIGLAFGKPEFLDEEQYCQAIYRFACEKRWLLKLPKQWITANARRLFEVLKRDVKRMDAILSNSFGCGMDYCRFLIVDGKRGNMPDSLVDAVLSKAPDVKEFLMSECDIHDEYYNYVVESDVLPELILADPWSIQFCWLAISLILHFKGDDKKTRIVIASTLGFSDNENLKLKSMGLKFGQKICEALTRPGQYSPEEVEYVTKILRICGLPEEHNSIA